MSHSTQHATACTDEAAIKLACELTESEFLGHKKSPAGVSVRLKDWIYPVTFAPDGKASMDTDDERNKSKMDRFYGFLDQYAVAAARLTYPEARIEQEVLADGEICLRIHAGAAAGYEV